MRTIRRLMLTGALVLPLCAAPTAAVAESPRLSTDGTAEQVAQLLDGRQVADLTDEELNDLIGLLPEDGSVIDITEGGPRPGARAPGVCESSTENVHLRTSSNKGAIGVKPTSKCTNVAQFMGIATVISKDTAFGWSKQGSTFTGSAYNTQKYTNTGIELKCTNTKATTWKAVNTHEIVDYKGCPHTLISSTPTSKLDCGT